MISLNNKKKCIVSINLGNYGSTGTIMKGISRLAEEKGYITYLAYPKHANNSPKADNDIIIVGGKYLRACKKLSYLTGYNGCFAFLPTLIFLARLSIINPDVVHLHNLHNSYINLPMLFSFLKKRKIKVIWTFVLFTGTPCQNRGLRAYLRKDYDRLVCQDIVCHGVPSPKVWERYLAFQENAEDSGIKNVNLRCKNQGWHSYSVFIEFNNGQLYERQATKDIMIQAFLSNICLRPSCYKCIHKNNNRSSDITLADFWGIENIIPEMDDNKGISLVWIHSEKGYHVFNSLNERMKIKAVDKSLALAYNSSALQSATSNPKREAFFCALEQYDFGTLVNKYCSVPLNRRIINTAKRVLQIGRKNKEIAK